MSIIFLTDAAKDRMVKDLEENGFKNIRLSLTKTGCSGLSYKMDYIDNPIANDLSLEIKNSYMLYIEKKSVPFIQGVHIDYVREGLNYKYIFKNPNQTGQCGCGESFTIRDE